MDALLLALNRSALAPHTALVLDEASMCGSRKLARLLEAAAASSAKVVLVGDTRQRSAVDAGGGFRGLVARLGAHQLLENRRQVQLWEREALRHLRESRTPARGHQLQDVTPDPSLHDRIAVCTSSVAADEAARRAANAGSQRRGSSRGP